jgi:hypothetical protein
MFGKMNKKYLIVCGDSFTKGHTLGEKGSWAYHVAKKMNLNLINLSANGMGNEWVASQLLSFLYRHESIVDDLEEILSSKYSAGYFILCVIPPTFAAR